MYARQSNSTRIWWPLLWLSVVVSAGLSHAQGGAGAGVNKGAQPFVGSGERARDRLLAQDQSERGPIAQQDGDFKGRSDDSGVSAKPGLVPVSEMTHDGNGKPVVIKMWVSEAAVDLVRRLSEAADGNPNGFGISNLIHEWNAGPPPRDGEWGFVVSRFAEMVKPPVVVKEDIEEIYKSMESVLVSFRARYTVTFSGVLRSGKARTPSTRTVSMAIKTDHSLLTWSEDREGGRLGKTVAVANGVKREFYIPEKEKGVAFISETKLREALIDKYNPLINARIRFPNLGLGQYNENLWQTFVGGMPVIVEGESTFNGHKCITVGQPEEMIYLCPDLNYAVVGCILGKYGIDHETGQYVTQAGYEVRRNEDFQEVVDGMWLPRRSNRQIMRAEKTVGEQVVVVESMEVNGELPDSTFTDLPDKMLVTDLIEDVSYRVGQQDQTITNSISDAIDSRTPSWPGRAWLVGVLNLLIGSGAIIFFVLSRRRKKQEP